MQNISYNMPEVRITKSWRKSISLRFDRDGVLQVKAPKFMTWWEIQAFIYKNTLWIQKHSQRIEIQQWEQKDYLFGEEISWDCIVSEKEKFYKSEAKKYILPRTIFLAESYGFSFEKIRITSAMTRWGSCSSKKNLSFSYRLIMAPRDCIDYVIIHELCHLRQMNHSAKFWWEVAVIMPEYKEYEKHLKKFWWRYRV